MSGSASASPLAAAISQFAVSSPWQHSATQHPWSCIPNTAPQLCLQICSLESYVCGTCCAYMLCFMFPESGDQSLVAKPVYSVWLTPLGCGNIYNGMGQGTLGSWAFIVVLPAGPVPSSFF
jgi:hypothetical protein